MPPRSDIDDSADPQDGAEVLDETNLTEDGEAIANFDTMADVYDATSREDDDDVEGLEAAEDEEDFDDEDADLIALSDDERDDKGLRPEGDRLPEHENTRGEVTAMPEPRSFEPKLDRINDTGADDLTPEEKKSLPYDDERKPPEHDPHTDRQLDHGLKETFPASDPVSINPGAD